MDGTYYYVGPDTFLFYLGRLLDSTRDSELHSLLGPLLNARIQERIGQSGNALDLAMRILTCDVFGIKDEIDLEVLLSLQCEDGGWGLDWMCRYGSGIKVANRGLTTAMAIRAIETASWAGSNLNDESIAACREEDRQMAVHPVTRSAAEFVRVAALNLWLLVQRVWPIRVPSTLIKRLKNKI